MRFSDKALCLDRVLRKDLNMVIKSTAEDIFVNLFEACLIFPVSCKHQKLVPQATAVTYSWKISCRPIYFLNCLCYRENAEASNLHEIGIRTVSDEVACVIAGVIQIDILVDDINNVKLESNQYVKNIERSVSLSK